MVLCARQFSQSKLHNNTVLWINLLDQSHPQTMSFLLRCFLGTVFLLSLRKSYSAMAQTFPATAEFDVVFPRNDTYAPVAIMPIVFAIQNPALGIPLSLSIHWQLRKAGSSPSENQILENHAESLLPDDPSTNNPYLIIRHSRELNNTEGDFFLWWQVYYGSCSTPINSTSGLGSQGWNRNYNTTYFKIATGAQQPSVVTEPDNCFIQSTTFNFTQTLDVSGEDYAVIAEPAPIATPCTVTINATLASGISASITSSACRGSPPSLASICSTKKGTAAKTNIGGTQWIMVASLAIAIFG